MVPSPSCCAQGTDPLLHPFWCPVLTTTTLLLLSYLAGDGDCRSVHYPQDWALPASLPTGVLIVWRVLCVAALVGIHVCCICLADALCPAHAMCAVAHPTPLTLLHRSPPILWRCWMSGPHAFLTSLITLKKAVMLHCLRHRWPKTCPRYVCVCGWACCGHAMDAQVTAVHTSLTPKYDMTSTLSHTVSHCLTLSSAAHCSACVPCVLLCLV
jgi:hypothetical protein